MTEPAGDAGHGAARPRQPRRLLVSLPAADSRARYFERCSQLPVTGAAVSIGLLAASVAGLNAAGQHASAAGDVLIPVTLISALFLVIVLIDLPNGIEIADGRFAIGAQGVPPAGALWRRITGPLEAVHSWDVISLEQVRRYRRAQLRSGRALRYLGDLRLFSRRRFLRLVVDPDSVQARFPSRVRRGFVLTSSSGAGVVWDGTILIGTRHHAALAAAMERALPGRRAHIPAP